VGALRAGEGQQPARERDQSVVASQARQVAPHLTCFLLSDPFQHGIFWEKETPQSSQIAASLMPAGMALKQQLQGKKRNYFAFLNRHVRFLSERRSSYLT